MLNNEDIQKIQNLLNEIQIKKDELKRKQQQTEIEIGVLEKEKENLQNYFKENLGTDDINEIENIVSQYEVEIKNWIIETQKQLTVINI